MEELAIEVDLPPAADLSLYRAKRIAIVGRDSKSSA